MLDHHYVSSEGRPLSPGRIAIGIRQMFIPEIEELAQHLQTGIPTNIPVKFQSKWEYLSGVVRQIRLFTDGALVLIDSPRAGSLLDHWDKFPLWIPREGTAPAGVLAPIY